MKKKSKGKTKKKKKTSGSDKELYWILGAMVGLIVVFLISFSIFQSMKTFEYQGLDFTKEKFGEIPLYRYYYFTNSLSTTGAVIGEPKLVNLYLRNDPRKINIPIEGEIEFPRKGKFVYITINGTGLDQCKYSSIALASLSSFLTQNDFTVKGAVPNEAEAEENNIKYATCETRPDNAVILIQTGQETKIVKEAENCYVISSTNCEILPAVERFMIQVIIDAKARQDI